MCCRHVRGVLRNKITSRRLHRTVLAFATQVNKQIKKKSVFLSTDGAGVFFIRRRRRRRHVPNYCIVFTVRTVRSERETLISYRYITYYSCWEFFFIGLFLFEIHATRRDAFDLFTEYILGNACFGKPIDIYS